MKRNNMRSKALFMFLGLLILIGCNLTTPISPGPLVTAHADIEGTENCTQCHILGKFVSDDKCLECHENINKLIEADQGYHASDEVQDKKCLECHSDHHGRDFDIIHFDSTKFEHKLTKYILEGKHDETACAACHKSEHIQDTALSQKPFTYLGLQDACLQCHEDYHQKTLDETCQDCHNFDAFDPAKKFDHDKTDYQLEGKHQDVKCEKCHEKTKRNGVDFQEFADIMHDKCTDCHEDKHDGKLGTRCEDCHNVNDFKKLNPDANFDHDLTDYKLIGKHKDVECYDCHENSCTASLAHEQCMDCHEDYHKGELKKNGKLQDCKTCHVVNGFKVPHFTVKQHNQTSFKLKGAHEATPCNACHRKQKDWHFKNIGKVCADCHKDIHKDKISRKYYGSASCESCHNVNAWKKVDFDHNKTKFKLKGAHKKESCKSCHFKSGDIKTHQKFKNLSTVCESCHTDEHAGQFQKQGKTNCSSCHGNDQFIPSNFNHDNARFKLDGKHKDVACNQCHKPTNIGNKRTINYKTNQLLCKDCH